MNTPARRVLITGTGTNVGKTFVGCNLLAALHRDGTRPLGLKPVETGYHQLESDAQKLATAAQHPLVAPWFTASAPVSPHRAARDGNRTLTSKQLADWVHTATANHPGPSLIETAGGLFSPLSEAESMLDVVRALEPCVFVLVACDRLGTLHDVQASVHAARALHRSPDVIVLNEFEPNALENAAELARLGVRIPVLRRARASDLKALCTLATNGAFTSSG